MLKWFRQYNKMLLVVMGSLLMVLFLIEPALNMFASKPGDQVIGTIGGKDMKLSEQQEAGQDLAVLTSLSPLLGQTDRGPIEPLQWVLMKREAANLGISASKMEARQLITLLQVDDRALDQMSRNMGMTRDQIVEVVRDWLAVQQYRELVLGMGHLPLQDRLQNVAMAYQMLQFGYVPGAVMALQASRGQPRVSEPLVQRFVLDQQASVQVTALPIDASRHLQDVPEPDNAAVEELFQQHKGDLPGSSKPYGLGYKYPDRVKIEYLTLPVDRLEALVVVSETQALAYYDANLEQFKTTGADGKTTGDPKPYAQVRDTIVRRLRSESAQQLGERVARAITAQLTEALRSSASANVADAIAQRIQSQFGVLPDVRRLDQAWLTSVDLAVLEGIGQAATGGRTPIPFTAYALAAQPLYDAQQKARPKTQRQPADPLAGMHLNTGEPSVPLTGSNGSFYVFRVLEAQPTHEPATLEEVRPKVVADARRLAAYRKLLEERNAWMGRARTQSLTDLAADLKVTPLSPAPFPRRQIGFQGGLEVPNVQGIGSHEQFVDGVFDLLDTATQEAEFASTLPAQRVGVIPVDGQQALYIVRLDEYTPVTQDEAKRSMSDPRLASMVSDLIVSEPTDDPVGVDALSKRLDFKPAGVAKDESAEPQAAAN
jgi:hypothetical protein